MRSEVPQEEPITVAPENLLSIKEVTGDVLEIFPEALVDLVSCVGLKRSPLTQRLSRLYPGYYETYKRLCLRNKLVLGQPLAHDLGTLFGTRWVIALPIQSHWKEMAKPTVVKMALAQLMDFCASNRITSCALPHFEGPPPGWLQSKITEEAARNPDSPLRTVYIFSE
jgi:hypothetical protein